MRVALLIFGLFIVKVSHCQKGTFDVMDIDTSLFVVKSLDGSEEIFLKQTNFKDGIYIVHSFGDKKIVRMRFEIISGKPCGEMIRYYWNGKIKSRKKYNKCK